jgi:hypothetical protein
MKGCSSIGEWQVAAHVRPGKEIDYKIVEKDLGMLGDELCCTSGAACAVEKRLNGPDELCIRPIVQSNVEPLNEQRPSYASASGQDKLGLMTGRSSISDDSLLDDNATSATPDGFGQLSEMTSRHANDDDDSIVDVSDESTAEGRRRLSLSSDSDCDDDSLDIDSFVKSWQKRTECKGNESQTGAKKPHNLINAGDICHIADNLPSYLCVSSNILMTDDASTSSQQNNVKKRNDVISTDTSTNKRSQECDERLDNLLLESNCSTDVKSGEQNEEQLLKVFEVAAAKTISDDISDRFSNSNDASVGANAVGSSDNGCGNPSMTASRWRPQQPLTMWNQGDLMAYCGDLLAWQQRYRQERLQRRHLQPSQQHHQKRRNGFAKADVMAHFLFSSI